MFSKRGSANQILADWAGLDRIKTEGAICREMSRGRDTDIVRRCGRYPFGLALFIYFGHDVQPIVREFLSRLITRSTRLFKMPRKYAVESDFE